jgi:hypothetical protein
MVGGFSAEEKHKQKDVSETHTTNCIDQKNTHTTTTCHYVLHNSTNTEAQIKAADKCYRFNISSDDFI